MTVWQRGVTAGLSILGLQDSVWLDAEEENATSAKTSPPNVLIGGPASKLWIPDRSIRE